MPLDSSAWLKQHPPKALATLTQPEPFWCLRAHPSEQWLLAGGGIGQLHRIQADGDSWKVASSVSVHSGWVPAIAFHPNGELVVTADTWGKLRCSRVADLAGKPSWEHPHAHAGWIRQLAISPNGTILASLGQDQMIHLWDIPTGKPTHSFRFTETDGFSLAFHPKQGSLITGDLHGFVCEWDPKTGKAIRRMQLPDFYKLDRIQDVGGIRCLRFAPDGNTILAAGCKPTTGGFVQGSSLLVWLDSQRWQVLTTIDSANPNDGFITDLAWHDAGFWLSCSSGQPGQGKLALYPERGGPSFWNAPAPNSHGLVWLARSQRVVVSQTNTGSNGNGRPKTANQEYPSNFSPLGQWRFGSA
ncbi:WD40 domain-containing protein [Tuwongella immobilis]|uniref:Anaphase-promoting complex subunit 4-like WD40 domain-containing protein n=1 Tax=Tuwongella immobilis TaxID=692036 RepID=A0A6C2YP79_9BACT|nr:hypothetical protein [Tuwongella immobilis]VIP03428.1 wd-repeat protein : WD-40 repeat protein OS=Pirellula staleyi (strain ATCC 27377 / DSM 6068 / ICPB 4128) GN=Psta_1602 PE=4 SV=1: WD40: WD40 [Tuwongella immobilis]VTS04228.1 wd-repeat protein : WD-40 repeat protein OS=Pirellula staleyi (strain ATCC 27377 / DSM 6068 / ICPB 4128) GN=Psta_1602 PE=4 SV=1: WD40: WD40 [Tuwongella immobilis]